MSENKGNKNGNENKFLILLWGFISFIFIVLWEAAKIVLVFGIPIVGIVFVTIPELFTFNVISSAIITTFALSMLLRAMYRVIVSKED